MHHCKLLLLLLCLLGAEAISASAPAANKDSTVTTYWRNGHKKTEFVYAVKKSKTATGQDMLLLNTVKKKRFFGSDGEETTEDMFNFSYKIEERIDSMTYAAKGKTSRQPGARVCFKPAAGSGNCLFMHFANDSSTVYREQDTLIASVAYTVIVYKQEANGATFAGALRTSDFQLYYYNGSTGAEELSLDLKSIVGELGKGLLGGAETYINATASIAQALGRGATKTLGFILANLILVSRP